VKKLTVSLILVVLLSILVLNGCSSPAPAPSAAPASSSSAPAPAAQPAQTQAQTQVIELKFAHHFTEQSGMNAILTDFANKLQEQTKGKAKITFYGNGSLAPPTEAYNAVIKGIADLEYTVTSLQSSRCVLTSFTDLPSMGWSKLADVPKAYAQLYEKYPQLKAEFQGTKIVSNGGTIGAMIHTKKAIKVPNDLKGMKLYAEMPFTQILKDVGVSPVSMSPLDLPMSLDRGVVEGAIFPLIVLNSLKLQPSVPFHTEARMGMQSTQVIMNQDKFNSLPPDVQKVINDLGPGLGEAITKYGVDQYSKVKEDTSKMSGQTFVELTPQDLALWTPIYSPFTDAWIAEREAKGLPAKQLVQDAQALVKQLASSP
jgi:TRAP-type C4-dicarboxylate transport system substrate-binding protein